MTWARFDDQFHDDPDCDKICDSAIALHVTGTTWCARNETDGLVPRERVKKLSGGTNPKAIKDLLRVGWWTEYGDYYNIRSFLKYNPSHKQLESQRAKTLGRVRKCRNGVPSNVGRNGVTVAVTHDVSNDPCTPAHARIPFPSPESQKERKNQERADADVDSQSEPPDANTESSVTYQLFPVKNDEGKVFFRFMNMRRDRERLPKIQAQLGRYQNLTDIEKSKLCGILTYIDEERWNNEDPFPKLTSWRAEHPSQNGNAFAVPPAVYREPNAPVDRFSKIRIRDEQ